MLTHAQDSYRTIIALDAADLRGFTQLTKSSFTSGFTSIFRIPK